MYRRLLLFFSLALLLTACVPPPSTSGVPVSGKVTEHRMPAAGIKVMAYPADAGALAGRAPYVTAATGSDGRFALSLPPGEYYFLARGEDRFAFYGRNPAAVPAQGLAELNLGLVTVSGTVPQDEPFAATGVLGRVLHDGRPLAGATVYVYTDLTSRLKGMGYVMAGPTDADGFFEAALPAGTYYMLARLRQGPGGVGPLRTGDFIGYFPGNPVKLGDGETARLVIPVLEVPEKVDLLAGELFGRTGIRGRILDTGGVPVAGARAVLYDDPQMFNRPLYVSLPAAADGSYLLSFPYGGTYYLAARDSLGGAPGPGDLYGTYDATPDHAVTVETGETLRGVDIVVEEMW